MGLPLPTNGEDVSGGPGGAAGLTDRLPRGMRGYNRAATDALFGEVASKHAELELECGELREQIAQLEADLSRHRKQEQLLSETLLGATSHATTIREKAREEAELILGKARAQLGERAAATERAERERAEAERELLRLRRLAEEMQRGLADFLTQALMQLGPSAEPGTAEPHPSDDADGGLVSTLAAALKPDDERWPGDNGPRPRGGASAPPRQSSG